MRYEPRRILATLAAHSVDSLLIGGVAGVVHGSIRTTEDVDILCHAGPDNLVRLASALTALEARVRGSSKPPGPIAPELLEGTSLITFETQVGDVDVFFAVPGLTTYDDFASRAVQVNIDGQIVSTVSRRDLITLKRATGRPEDIGAAEELEELERLEVNEPAGGPG